MQSLGGLRVLELSGRIAGAYCGKLFAGLGADVLRLPGGQTPVLDDDERVWFHTAKRETKLDPADLGQRAALEALVRGADVLLDAWGYGVLAASGLDASRLLALNPRLVVCQVTPFGQTGPRRAWQAEDITLYAAAGLMNSTGDGQREPLHARPRICELTAGMNAYIACLMALLRRERDGAGDVIDLSIQEAAMENYEVAIKEFLALGKIARRNGDQHAMVPWRTYPCADGHVTVIGGPVRNWLRAARMFEVPALLESRLGGMDGRIRHRVEFESLITPWLKVHGRRELFHAGQKEGLAWSYLASVPEAIADPQTVARGFLVEIDQPGRGSVRLPGAPFRSERAAWRDAPAPSGAMPVEQAAALWSEGREGAAPQGAAASSAAPLAGLCVLDFTHDWAGPHAARVLADFGAEVIKIEYPKRLDGMRGGDVSLIDERPRFWQLHRGKKSLTLDLKVDSHRRVLDDLVARSDVVLENSRAGVMERKGYGYARLQQLKPHIVVVAMSAFGATGPYADYCGYGGTLEAISGLQSLTAYDAESPWYRIREMDVMNGIMGACAAMTGLLHRRRTGQGQWIDLAEWETTAWFVGEHFLRAARTHEQPAPLGNRHASHAPQGCYPAAGEDRWVVLCVRSDAEWQKLAVLMGRETYAHDPRFATAWERRARQSVLDVMLAEWLVQQDPAAVVEALQGLGIAASQVANTADLATDPHLAAREWFQTVDGDRFPGFPFRFARGGAHIAARGPSLGAHNAEYFTAAGLRDSMPDLGPARIGTAYALG